MNFLEGYIVFIKRLFLISGLLVGKSFSAAYDVAHRQEDLPEYFLVPCGSMIPSFDATLKIKTQDIEPLTGKTYGTLHQEASNEGLPLALTLIIWWQMIDRKMSTEIFDLCSFVRAFGSKKKDFTSIGTTNETLTVCFRNYADNKQKEDRIHFKAPVVNDGFVSYDNPGKYPIVCNFYCIGSDYRQMNEISISHEGTISLFLRSQLNKDADALKMLVLMYALGSKKKGVLETYPAITTHAASLMNGYLKKHPEQEIEVRNWIASLTCTDSSTAEIEQ
jgi:hypothetical protein